MSTFWRCYYHLIWTTKERQPLISPHIEPYLYDSISQQCDKLGIEIIALNSMSDHVHLAASIPPKLAIADCMQRIKGGSSFAINQAFPHEPTLFKWQTAYGVLTFGAKALPFVKRYIEQQKVHHQAGTIEPYLETIDEG